MTLKKGSMEVGATEFKAHCLELMQKVSERKLNSVIVTKRGKPFVKVVPAAEGKPLYGCMQGQIRIHGDITAPWT